MSKLLDSVIGHQAELKTLVADWQNKALPSAYLFFGPPRVGKEYVARRLAATLQCPHGGCGECETCGQHESNTFFDTIRVGKLWMKGKQEDLAEIAKSTNIDQAVRIKSNRKTNQIGTGDIGQVLERVMSKTNSPYKIVILSDVERLNIAAGNKLLKTIEEPPERTLFILTTSRIDLVLPTIISRCRVVQFRGVEEGEVKKALGKVPAQKLEKILFYAAGRPGEALALATDEERFAKYEEVYEQVEQFARDPYLHKRFKIAEIMAKSPGELRLFLELLLYYVRALAEGKKTKKYTRLMRRIVLTDRRIDQGISPRPMLELLALSL